MISPINTYNINNYSTPGFKGIVKIEQVFLDGKKVEPVFVNGVNTTIKAAAQRIKDFLMGKEGIVQESALTEYFRKIYGIFDRDYRLIPQKTSGSTRKFFDKIRGKNSYYLISDTHAASMAKKGPAIGKKNVAGNPREEYSEGIKEIEKAYAKLNLQPKMTIHTYSDKKGTIRLSGVEIGTGKEPMYSFSFPPFSPKKTTIKKVKTVIPTPPPSVQQRTEIQQGKKKIVFSIKETETHKPNIATVDNPNATLEELSKKSWPKKPVQMEFNF